MASATIWPNRSVWTADAAPGGHRVSDAVDSARTGRAIPCDTAADRHVFPPPLHTAHDVGMQKGREAPASRCHGTESSNPPLRCRGSEKERKIPPPVATITKKNGGGTGKAASRSYPYRAANEPHIRRTISAYKPHNGRAKNHTHGTSGRQDPSQPDHSAVRPLSNDIFSGLSVPHRPASVPAVSTLPKYYRLSAERKP